MNEFIQRPKFPLHDKRPLTKDDMVRFASRADSMLDGGAPLTDEQHAALKEVIRLVWTVGLSSPLTSFISAS